MATTKTNVPGIPVVRTVRKLRSSIVSNRKLQCGLALVLLLCIMCTQLWDTKVQESKGKKSGPASQYSGAKYPQRTGWLVDSSTCRIPDYDPWDGSITALLANERRFPGCKKEYMVRIEQDGHQVLMHKNTSAKQFCYIECCYRSVSRSSEGKSDDKYQFGNKSVCFEEKTSLRVNDEFIQVRCFCKSKISKIIHEDFKAFVFPKVGQRGGAALNVTGTRDNLNVYLIGLDSISRLNFKRYMPDLENVLSHDFNAIPMLGLTKVGVNTFPNMLPFLAGQSMDQLLKNQSLRLQPFDGIPFVWKTFSELGYVTMFNEDGPVLATFNFKKKGFFVTPTDFYLRPLFRAIEDSKYVKSRATFCVNHRSQIDFQLQWLKDFMTVEKPASQFGLLFSSAVSHEGPLTFIKNMQDRLITFFKWYRQSERYNSSIMIFFSDHGMRFGPVMRYELGGYESRMPFFYVLLPPWYSSRHPHRVASLRANSRRLTTFYDAHEMLRDLLRDAGGVSLPAVNNSGVSLFRPVPANRSCDSAGISHHWCVCLTRIPVSVDMAAIRSGALVIVRHINEVKLQDVRELCAHLSLLSVTGAFHQKEQKQYKEQDTSYTRKSYDEYVVQLLTVPGRAEFEATVRVRGDQVSVVDVSRLDVYKGQSDCLEHHFDEKRFCYCRNLL